MKPGVVLRGNCDEQNLEMQMERQMGCMAGFLQIFDRQQILAVRRGIYSAKRLPSAPSPVPSCTSPSERSDSSLSSSSKEIPSPPPPQTQAPSEMRPPSPEPPAWADIPARPSLPLPVFDYKEGSRSSWKFREAPRLSLDSRVDGRGKLYPREIRTVPLSQPEESDASDNQDKQRRSPSVVARLMGLDALPGDVGGGAAGADRMSYKRPELRRSASESRASRELLHYQFVDDSSCFQQPTPPAHLTCEDGFRQVRQSIVRDTKPEPVTSRLSLAVCPPLHPHTAFCALQRKSFFDVQDYFVSQLPKRSGTGSLYGEIEKRLRMRGIDEPAKDLETLKQILEAIQLKGLLHSRQQQQRDGRSDVPRQQNGPNFVYDEIPMRTNCYDSPIVVMQPAPRSLSRRSPPPSSYSRSNASPPTLRRNQLVSSETASRLPRQNLVEIGRNASRGNNGIRAGGAGTPDPIKARSSVSPIRRRSPPPSASVCAGGSRPGTDRRTSCAQSPKSGSPRKAGSDPATRSPRNSGRPRSIVSTTERICHRPEEDEVTVSDGGFSASSHFDFERVKSEYRDGRILLERCDKLLHSIAEITSKAAADDEDEQVNAAEQQPSPVSVLDAAASFDGDVAGGSPSPVLSKRCIDFEDQSGKELIPSSSSVKSNHDAGSEIDGSDFSYLSEILLACDTHQTAEKSFSPSEAQRRKTGDAAADTSKDFPLHRKLVFDAVSEIVERRMQVSPWEAFLRSRSPVAGEGRPLPGEVWAELRRIQEHAPADDLCEVICGVLRKDMTSASAAERAWSGQLVEMSDAVLDIERLIFKDLVGETITQLAAFYEGWRQCRAAVPPRRRLLF